eukprot:TRINITY_DN21912_c0_g1_i1.p1 TRINITY_DN21912_c0_g1~~TRINITY_DN21912_c0_g1_i1.p1  ORF type:complete len:662 (+),score=219.05 TRINITY_DN21912_c0_g1_i1:78-2063(+)
MPPLNMSSTQWVRATMIVAVIASLQVLFMRGSFAVRRSQDELEEQHLEQLHSLKRERERRAAATRAPGKTPLPQQEGGDSNSNVDGSAAETRQVLPSKDMPKGGASPSPTAQQPESPKPAPLLHRLAAQSKAARKKAEPTSHEMSTSMARISPETHQWHLGVCASTFEGGEYLEEWIQFHKLAGVDHIFIFDYNDYSVPHNPEEEMTRRTLKRHQAAGDVTIVHESLPQAPENDTKGCQMHLRSTNWFSGFTPPSIKTCWFMKKCHRVVAPYVTWLLPLTTSDYVYPRTGCSLSKYIKKKCLKNLAYIPIAWERFGSSDFLEAQEGLRLESQLSSGGDCSNYEYEEDCGAYPEAPCGECRKTRIIYNVKKCVKKSHMAAWTHPVNTSQWKSAMRQRRRRATEEGDTSVLRGHFKRIGRGKDDNWKDVDACEDGLLSYPSLVTPSKKKCISPQHCCGSGIRMNHYEMKSKADYEHLLRSKLLRVQKAGVTAKQRSEDDEYYADPKEGLKRDLSGSIGLSILRYTRSLHSSVKTQGDNGRVSYVETESGTCLVEDGMQYTALHGTEGDTTGDDSAEACCKTCLSVSGCQLWSFDVKKKECTFLKGPATVVVGEDVFPKKRIHRNHTVPAGRAIADGFTSGIPVPQRECIAPSESDANNREQNR